MDYERLRAIKQRAENATGGPWRLGEYRGMGEDHDIETADGEPLDGTMRGMFSKRADAEFAAHAREDVPALIEALEEIHRSMEYPNSDNRPGAIPHPGRNQTKGM